MWLLVTHVYTVCAHLPGRTEAKGMSEVLIPGGPGPVGEAGLVLVVVHLREDHSSLATC